MKLIQKIRVALAITVLLLCAGIAGAQDAASSWLLRSPQVSSRRVLDFSAARVDLKQAQAPPADSQRSTANNSAARIPSTQDRHSVARGEHRFWDTTNDLLFAGVGASRTLDYFSTLNMRRRGRDEILLNNDVVDNHAAFAAIEAAGTGASIGLSYLFHHYGHHKLERATSIVHIGLATTGAVRNYCLKTAHPAIASPASATFTAAPGIASLAGPH